MLSVSLHPFKHKKVLLLQGPVGPFFRNFADDLRRLDARVFKINFNAGDCFFYPQGVNFRRPMSEWPEFLQRFIRRHAVDIIVLFGDCRSIHMAAKEVAQETGTDVYVFEEGYLRPNHITMEHLGVNGYSQFVPQVRDYLNSFYLGKMRPPPFVDVGKTYWYAAWWAVLYYMAASFGRRKFPHYRHHRPLQIREGLYWIRGAFRKQWFRFQERGIAAKLAGKWSQRYFLVPLQVHNDAQISHHSPYAAIEDFIEEVIVSFAKNAPQDCILVLKQHPFDRAYKDYGRLIRELGGSLGCAERIFYIHDQHLPTLLTHARGVVVINSTVGLSAVKELLPVKVCGESVYNIRGLTVQDALDGFWSAAEHFRPNRMYINHYLDYLCRNTQHNGSFYRKIKSSPYQTGVIWY